MSRSTTTEDDKSKIADNGVDRTTNRAESTQYYQDAQAEASYCTGRRTSRNGLGMVSSGGSGVGEQRWHRWIGSGVQRCAAAEQLRRRRGERLQGGCGRRGWSEGAVQWWTSEGGEGHASLQDGDAVVGATLGNDAGDQQDATSANSSDSGEPPTRTTSNSGGLDLLTAAAGGEAGGRAGGRLADSLQVDTRQRADGGDRRVQRTIA
ncbi:hypothetical protein Scep_023676 [Stephania cephalantha]|uniref:Uncharacterized protein n=1 Tax=Stephania cephalantha TaxID=152367 RepID=A0AAP0HXI0_9MAGN